MIDEPKSKGLHHVMTEAEAAVPLHNYAGVVTWTGENHFCLYDALGMKVCCWSLDELIVGGFIERDTIVSHKTEAEHILNRIVDKLHWVHQEREKGKSKN